MYKFLFFVFFLISSITNVFAYNNKTLAECSALNNNFNQKYGAQLLDNGETYNTVMKDKLYYMSSTYQMLIMSKVSYIENWNLKSYEEFRKEIDSSEFYSQMWSYDTKSMQGLSLGSLQIKISDNGCYEKFQKFGRSPGKEDEILKRFDVLSVYVEKLRGF